MINKLRLFKNIFIKPYFNEKFPPLNKVKIINIINKLKDTDSSLDLILTILKVIFLVLMQFYFFLYLLVMSYRFQYSELRLPIF